MEAAGLTIRSELRATWLGERCSSSGLHYLTLQWLLAGNARHPAQSPWRQKPSNVSNKIIYQWIQSEWVLLQPPGFQTPSFSPLCFSRTGVSGSYPERVCKHMLSVNSWLVGIHSLILLSFSNTSVCLRRFCCLLGCRNPVLCWARLSGEFNCGIWESSDGCISIPNLQLKD